MALCPAVRGSPTPLASGKVTDKHNGGGGGGRKEEEGGKRRGAHWDTSSGSLWPQNRNCDGAARDTSLNYLALFLLRRLVFTCTYAHRHMGCLQCVCENNSESTVYTPEYTVLLKTTSQLESVILFLSPRSAATSNASSRLLIMLHTDGIASSVTDTYYYNM